VTETEVATVTVSTDGLLDLLAMSASVTLIEDAVQNLSNIPLGDDDVAALRLLPEQPRMQITARLIELAEVLREVLRELDGQLLGLTAGQQDS
jgi:hypothetical protein